MGTRLDARPGSLHGNFSIVGGEREKDSAFTRGANSRGWLDFWLPKITTSLVGV